MAGMEPHHMNGSLGKTDLTDITQWYISWVDPYLLSNELLTLLKSGENLPS